MARYTRQQKLAFAKTLRHRATRAEALLWERLSGNQMNGWHFRRQHLLYGYIADFACKRARLVVELDGSSHRGRELSDATRDRVMEEGGWTVMRFPNWRVFRDIEGVLDEIRAELGGVGPSKRNPVLTNAA